MRSYLAEDARPRRRSFHGSGSEASKGFLTDRGGVGRRSASQLQVPREAMRLKSADLAQDSQVWVRLTHRDFSRYRSRSSGNLNGDTVHANSTVSNSFPLYERAVVTEVGGGRFNKIPMDNVRVKMGTGRVMVVASSACDFVNDGDSSSPSLCSLDYVNDPSVLDILKTRYFQDLFWTYSAGCALLSLNSYQATNIVNEEVVEVLASGSDGSPDAHIYNLCQEVRQRASFGDHSFILQGESGSGKTEAAKHIVAYFSTARRGRGPGGSQPGFCLSQRGDGRLYATAKDLPAGASEAPSAAVVGGSLLEAFGNASTERNANSSRFGRVTRLRAADAGLRACEIKTIFLERSRMTAPPHGERSFHVYYQLLRGIDEDIANQLGLPSKDPQRYRYLRGPYSSSSEQDDRCAWLEETLPNLSAIGLDVEEVVPVLAAVLLCSEDPSLRLVCGLLGLGDRAVELSAALLPARASLPRNEVVTTPRSSVSTPRAVSPEQAAADLLARSLHEALFHLVVAAANDASNAAQVGDGPWVAILDLCGFELIQSNSLEQMLRNLGAEVAQQLFISWVYKLEHELYEAEGIGYIPLNFEDNLQVVQVLDEASPTKGVGILQLLEEQCSLEGGSDEKFVANCHRSFKERPNVLYSELRGTGPSFEIIHGSGAVRYDTKSFRMKNMDRLPAAARQLLSSSTTPLVSSMFTQSAASSTARPGSVFAAGKYLSDISSALNILRQSQLRFVKCVSTNTLQRPLDFDDGLVLTQLEALGVMESLRLDRLRFAYRRTYHDFVDEYKVIQILLGKVLNDTSGTIRARATQILVALEEMLSPAEAKSIECRYEFGRTLVFLTSRMHACAERTKARLTAQAAGYCRRIIWAQTAQHNRRQFNKAVDVLVTIQSRYRRFRAQKDDKARQDRVASLQRGFVGTSLLLRSAFVVKAQRRAAITLQRFARGFLGRRRAEHIRRLPFEPQARQIILQCIRRRQAWECVRLRAVARQQAHERAALIFLQAELRTQLAKRELSIRRFWKALRLIQSCWRGSRARKIARRARRARRVECSKVVRKSLQAMRCRLTLALFKDTEHFRTGESALHLSRSLNHLMDFSGRYHMVPTPLMRSSTPAPTAPFPGLRRRSDGGSPLHSPRPQDLSGKEGVKKDFLQNDSMDMMVPVSEGYLDFLQNDYNEFYTQFSPRQLAEGPRQFSPRGEGAVQGVSRASCSPRQHLGPYSNKGRIPSCASSTALQVSPRTGIHETGEPARRRPGSRPAGKDEAALLYGTGIAAHGFAPQELQKWLGCLRYESNELYRTGQLTGLSTKLVSEPEDQVMAIDESAPSSARSPRGSVPSKASVASTASSNNGPCTMPMGRIPSLQLGVIRNGTAGESHMSPRHERPDGMSPRAEGISPRGTADARPVPNKQIGFPPHRPVSPRHMGERCIPGPMRDILSQKKARSLSKERSPRKRDELSDERSPRNWARKQDELQKASWPFTSSVGVHVESSASTGPNVIYFDRPHPGSRTWLPPRHPSPENALTELSIAAPRQNGAPQVPSQSSWPFSSSCSNSAGELRPISRERIVASRQNAAQSLGDAALKQNAQTVVSGIRGTTSPTRLSPRPEVTRVHSPNAKVVGTTSNRRTGTERERGSIWGPKASEKPLYVCKPARNSTPSGGRGSGGYPGKGGVKQRPSSQEKARGVARPQSANSAVASGRRSISGNATSVRSFFTSDPTRAGPPKDVAHDAADAGLREVEQEQPPIKEKKVTANSQSYKFGTGRTGTPGRIPLSGELRGAQIDSNRLLALRD